MDKVRNFSKVGDAAPVPNLIDIQLAGYDRFLQKDPGASGRKAEGLEALLREIFPIVSYDKQIQLEYISYELGESRYAPQECRDLRLTYGMPFRIRCRLVRTDRKEVIEESIYVGEVPIMIGGGEFIINGAERVIVSQLHRSPGVDFTVEMQESDRPLHGARIIPERGSWIEMSVTKKDALTIRIDPARSPPQCSCGRWTPGTAPTPTSSASSTRPGPWRSISSACRCTSSSRSWTPTRLRKSSPPAGRSARR
jgi:DNA-directed RNA polymerase subunit beta